MEIFQAQLFDHHAMNYPKVAKYFRAKSAEELSHAERFIQYQNQRGGKVEMNSATVSFVTCGFPYSLTREY